MGGLNETIMEAEPLLSLPMGPVRTLGDNRVGWIPNCEDAAPPRCAPVCKATCCAFCAFCALRYSNSARASRGLCSACYAFCACYLVCTCCTRCARSTRFQNLTCNTVGHKSALHPKGQGTRNCWRAQKKMRRILGLMIMGEHNPLATICTFLPFILMPLMFTGGRAFQRPRPLV